MAYQRLRVIARYEGVSTDTKPVTTTDATVVEGAQLHEIDTGKDFIYASGNWIEDVRRVNKDNFDVTHAASRRLAEREALKSTIEYFPDRGSYNFIENR